ncbi:pyruvate kinase [Adlercreutzia agrestimuris]|uniref:pyruvate kinase n=1 Tax=Adlercreutzia agrestimuris TaxID=2941324 RepID=UPI00203B779F|nr:pyruvate kinase [Adlercreutzia agrestimuris]
MTKRTKIVCTLGPATDDDAIVRGMLQAGMDVARFNCSHGSHEEHAARLERLRRVRAELDSPCAMLLDTRGPEIRTGLLLDGKPVALTSGSQLRLKATSCVGNEYQVSQSFPDLARYVAAGDNILLDDGLIALTVREIDGQDILCTVINDGVLGQRKSLNVPGVSLPLPALTEQDRQDLLFGIEQNIDFVAASFIRSAADVEEVRAFLYGHGGAGIQSGTSIGIIAKIECAEAVANFEEILDAADGIMVARGDLGVEVPAWQVPHLQKRFIRAANRMSKPVITATQMLDSMIRSPRPTRAEVADVANAVYDGTDAVMLSGETANGAYPVESVAMMANILEASEPYLFDERMPDRTRNKARVALAVGIAAVQTAENINASCIVAPTMSGRTSRLVSNLRPRVPIYVVTPYERVMRQQQLNWGTYPMLGDVQGDMAQVIREAKRAVFAHGMVSVGDIAVFTVGDRTTSPDVEPNVPANVGVVAATNVMYVVQIREEE